MARSLASKPNVESPAGDYPYGRPKDNPGDNTGTPVNRLLVEDSLLYFEKLLAQAGITANENPENDSAGYQYMTALLTLIGTNSAGYRDVSSQPFMKKKVIEIGDWNMDSTSSVAIAHGLTLSKIRHVSVFIISDDAASLYPIHYSPSSDAGNVQGSIAATDATNVNIARFTAGFFDSTSFDSTSYNRGFITIDYEA